MQNNRFAPIAPVENNQAEDNNAPARPRSFLRKYSVAISALSMAAIGGILAIVGNLASINALLIAGLCMAIFGALAVAVIGFCIKRCVDPEPLAPNPRNIERDRNIEHRNQLLQNYHDPNYTMSLRVGRATVQSLIESALTDGYIDNVKKFKELLEKGYENCNPEEKGVLENHMDYVIRTLTTNPDGQPVSFTVEQLQKKINEVCQEEQNKEQGNDDGIKLNDIQFNVNNVVHNDTSQSVLSDIQGFANDDNRNTIPHQTRIGKKMPKNSVNHRDIELHSPRAEGRGGYGMCFC